MEALSLPNSSALFQDATQDIDVIEKAHASLEALQTFGVTLSTVAILRSQGLLTSVHYERMATETFHSFHMSQQDLEIACEGLIDTIKGRLVTWSSKITGAFSKSLDAIAAFTRKVKTRLAELSGKGHPDHIADTTKPIPTAKEVNDAVSAAKMTIAVVSDTGKDLPSPKDEDKTKSFLKSLQQKIAKITWPFGKIEVSATEKTISADIPAVEPKSLTTDPKKGGWTTSSFTALGGSVASICDSISQAWTSTKTAVAPIVRETGHIVSTAAAGASNAYKQGSRSFNGESRLGAKGSIWDTGAGVVMGTVSAFFALYCAVVVAALYILYKLIKTIIFGVVTLVMSVFDALMSNSDHVK